MRHQLYSQLRQGSSVASVYSLLQYRLACNFIILEKGKRKDIQLIQRKEIEAISILKVYIIVTTSVPHEQYFRLKPCPHLRWSCRVLRAKVACVTFPVRHQLRCVVFRCLPRRTAHQMVSNACCCRFVMPSSERVPWLALQSSW